MTDYQLSLPGDKIDASLINLNQYICDASEVDQGIAGNGNSLKDLIDDIGISKSTTIYLLHDPSVGDNTTYTLTTSTSLPDNIFINLQPGAVLDGAGTLTFDNAEQIIAQPNQQIFGSSITVVFTNGGAAYPEWWGIDGTADEVQINKAYTAAGQVEFIDGKTYTCNDEIVVPANKDLIANCIFDFDGASGTFANDACIYVAGSGLTSLGVLATTMDKGDKEVVAPSAPDVEQGDIIVLWDSADSSYSGFETYYRAGEHMVVESVSSNTITTVEGSYAGYASGGTVTIYKMGATTVNLSGFTVIGRGVGSSTNCMILEHSKDSIVEKIVASNSQDNNLSISKSYNVSISKITSTILLDNVYDTGYALTLSNVQNVRVSDSNLTSVKHGLAIGGGSAAGSIVNRDIIVSNTTLHTTSVGGSIAAGDMHGNSEYVSHINCIITGIRMGGNHNRLIDNIIHGDAAELIHFSQMSGFDHEIRGNTGYIFKDPPSGRGSFVDIGGNSSNVLDGNTSVGGMLKITNNKIYDSREDSEVNLILIENRGCTQTDLNIDISDNSFIRGFDTRGSNFAIETQATIGTTAFNSVTITNNYLYSGGIEVVGALNVTIKSNTVINSGMRGIRAKIGDVATGTPEVYSVIDNIVRGSRLGGIFVEGESGNEIEHVNLKNNISIENSRVASGSTATDTGARIIEALKVFSYDNIFGGTGTHQQYPARHVNVDALYELRNHYFGTGSFATSGVTFAGITAASSGDGSVKMGSGSNADSAGWIEIAPSKFIPYWTDETP